MQLELSFQVPEANLIAKNMSKLVTLFTQKIRFLHLLLMSEASMLIIESGLHKSLFRVVSIHETR